MALRPWLTLTICPSTNAQIIRKIECLQSGLHGNLKRLREAEAMYRLRMGDYRVLFDVEGDVIVIRRIGNRKDVYD